MYEGGNEVGHFPLQLDVPSFETFWISPLLASNHKLLLPLAVRHSVHPQFGTQYTLSLALSTPSVWHSVHPQFGTQYTLSLALSTPSVWHLVHPQFALSTLSVWHSAHPQFGTQHTLSLALSTPSSLNGFHNHYNQIQTQRKFCAAFEIIWISRNCDSHEPFRTYPSAKSAIYLLRTHINAGNPYFTSTFTCQYIQSNVTISSQPVK